MKTAIKNTWEWCKKHHLSIITPVAIVVMVRECQTNTEARAASIEEIKAAKYLEGYSDGYNGAMDDCIGAEPIEDVKKVSNQ